MIIIAKKAKKSFGRPRVFRNVENVDKSDRSSIKANYNNFISKLKAKDARGAKIKPKTGQKSKKSPAKKKTDN